MKTNGTRYSPAFKFQVVLEALKAEGKGAEAQVARAYGVHQVILANWEGTSRMVRRCSGPKPVTGDA